MKVGIIQQPNTGDARNNIDRLKEKISSAAQQGAELIVLQELHNSLYFCQVEDPAVCDLAEPIPVPSTDEFGE